MLPDADHVPSVISQRFAVGTIALYVSGDLRLPISNIGLRTQSAFLAAVPIAAVDKHCYAMPWKHEIRPTTELAFKTFFLDFESAVK